jgi:hypothetical protein
MAKVIIFAQMIFLKAKELEKVIHILVDELLLAER